MLPALRRMIPATAVALAVAFVGFGVVGLASAESTEAETVEPVTFRIAERHVGDRSVVRSAIETVAPDGTQIMAQEVTIDWTWGPEQAWFDGRDGTWHAAHPHVRAQETEEFDDDISQASLQWTWALWVETATDQVLGDAFDDVFAWGYSGGLAGPLAREHATTSVGRTLYYSDGPDCALERMVREGLQLGSDVTLVDECLAPEAGPVTFTIGNGQVGDVTTVRFTTHVGRTTITADYASSLPEVVQVEHVGVDEQGNVHRSLWTLTGFEAGTEPWDTGLALPEPTALPPVTLAATKPWGPDDEGVDHPFPASAAWTSALEDPDYLAFRDYMAQHPAGMATHAEYQEWQDGNTTERQWYFQVHDGSSGIGFWSTQTTSPPAAYVTDPLGLPSLPGEPVVTTDTSDGFADDPCAMPSQLPTAASMLARWQATTGAAEQGNFWSMTCRDDDVHLDAGWQGAAGEATTVQDIVGQAQSTISAGLSVLRFKADGAVWGAQSDHSETVLERAPDGAPPAPPASDSDKLAQAPRLVVAGLAWSQPTTPAASGAAAVSLLAGLLYWLWPALKGGAAGLFSRIETPRLLAHPMRRAIADAVEAEPGIHYQAIVRLVGGGKGAVDHHLRKLVAAGLLLRHQGPGFTCYFPPKVDRRVTATAGVLKSEGARRVLAAVQAHPGATSVQLAAVTGLDASTVSHHVHRLAAAGVLQATKVGRTLVVQPTFLAGQVTAAGAA